MVKSITPQDMVKEVVSSTKPMLVAFLKQGQRQREQLELLDRAERRYARSVDCYLYSDGFLETGMRQHFVSGTPTYLLFQDGWEVDRLMGCSDDDMLDSFLRRSLKRKD
ncbi:thioredoxin [Salidesulfovibrio onnuriiensis]|uniref:thioredoxin n=1 Tax=Salidesulfovibrio onnuriiensis TaxID=2583823 RepID=UPI0011CAB335|nr:thioredoxin [Salidesulfovibrio onnuriiensis]